MSRIPVDACGLVSTWACSQLTDMYINYYTYALSEAWSCIHTVKPPMVIPYSCSSCKYANQWTVRIATDRAE